MTDPRSTQEKFTGVAADVSNTFQDAVKEAKPVVERMTDRLSDSVHDMAHHSKEAAVDAKKLLEEKTDKLATAAEYYIHSAPLKSMLIAAGVGAVTVTVLSLLMRSRSH